MAPASRKLGAMFTGLIQAQGQVAEKADDRLSIAYPVGAWEDAFVIGESVAVNGCCLTVVSDSDQRLDFDVSDETWRRTALGSLIENSSVNLERSMRPIDRFGGHIVQGHIDGVGEIIDIVGGESATRIRFRVSEDGSKYLIDKGSIALDGISLTVVEPQENEFDVWVIPHTLQLTNLGTAKIGNKINVEYDVLAKHVEKLLASPR